MKKTCFLAIGLFLFGCKKNSPSMTSNAPGRLVSSIVLYNSLAHTLEIQTFAYNGSLLTNYSDKTIDSTGPSQIYIEIRNYSFSYAGKNSPVSSTFVDTTYIGSTSPTLVGANYNLGYDPQGRLIIDSGTVAYGGYTPQTFYNYAGDSISVVNRNPGAPNYPAGVLTISGGNVIKVGSSIYTYGSNANPMYNSAIGSSFAPFFYYGLLAVYLESFAVTPDFFSKNLPIEISSPGSTNKVSFSWVTGADGRVVGGTVSNRHPFSPAINGPEQITFNYY
jgi:hypothetical protein